MSEEKIKEILADVRRRMSSALEALGRELGTVRTGRASLSLLDGISVEYYGTPTPLGQVATLSVPEGSLITIQPWDPGLIGEIEKAIMRSDLGLTPSSDGKIVRLPIPPLTEERRKQLARRVSKIGEEAKNGIRLIRREGNERAKKLQHEKIFSEDEEHRSFEQVQKVTDDFTKKIDELVKKKEAEILEL